jgi:hypothetical protein
MKFNNIVNIMLVACLFIIACKKEVVTEVPRPETPTNLTVSKGDTSVFIKWDAVPSAESYLIVRGLKAIVQDLKSTSYEDQAAPDTSVEYRVYAVNKTGWRSYRYVSDSGYVAIPSGTLPRPPIVTATDNDYRYVTLTFSDAKFATGYNIYRNGVKIADNFIQNTFNDTGALVTNSIYEVYSVNKNGVSATKATATGRKALLYNGNYEDKDDGYILTPWTFVEDKIGYYTEGNPVVVSGLGEDNSKALKIVGGKAQLLYDWGGVPATGKYKISLSVKKSNGGFWIVPSFTDAAHIGASGNWEHYSITTAVLQKGDSFNLKLEPYGNDAAFVDNWTIEYLLP